MSCFFPKELFVKDKEGVGHDGKRLITVPCGKCVGCYLDYTNEWSLRCWLEMKQCEKSCFITLTYNNEHLPSEGQLNRKDVQLFLKRLRRRIEPVKIRFFGCGEYGSKGERPHYHLIIFNWFPDDLIELKRTKRGEVIYRSSFIESLWQLGFSSVGYASLSSVKYCTKYLQKMVFNFNKFKVKPFTMCSTRIPIGFNSLTSKEILNDEIYMNGKSYKLPRSFLLRLKNEALFLYEDIKEKRKERSLFFEKELKPDVEQQKIKYKNLLNAIDFYSNM